MKVYRTPFSLGYWRDALRDLKDLRKLTFAALMIAACLILNKFKIPLGEGLSLSVTFLARALCATQTMLLLDEPVAGLDPLVTREMYQIISMLHREQNLTVVMISHDIQAALHHGDIFLGEGGAQQLGHQSGGGGGIGGGLHHAAVARRNSADQRPHREQEGVVPRGHDERNAVGAAHGEAAGGELVQGRSHPLIPGQLFQIFQTLHQKLNY